MYLVITEDGDIMRMADINDAILKSADEQNIIADLIRIDGDIPMIYGGGGEWFPVDEVGEVE